MMKIAPTSNHRTKNPEAGNRVRRLLARTYSRAALPYLGVGLLLIVAIVVGGREIEHHINAIESWITELGPWGVLAFIGLFTLTTSLLLPDTLESGYHQLPARCCRCTLLRFFDCLPGTHT